MGCLAANVHSIVIAHARHDDFGEVNGRYTKSFLWNIHLPLNDRNQRDVLHYLPRSLLDPAGNSIVIAHAPNVGSSKALIIGVYMI